MSEAAIEMKSYWHGFSFVHPGHEDYTNDGNNTCAVLFSNHDDHETLKVWGKDEKSLREHVHVYLYENVARYKELWDREMSVKLMVETITTTDWKFGAVSLVGISGKDFPLNHGNYFSMSPDGNKDGDWGWGVGIINIWYENLKEAIERFDIKELTFEIFNDGRGMIVTSPLIPDDWYIKDLFMAYNCSLNDIEKYQIRKLKGII